MFMLKVSEVGILHGQLGQFRGAFFNEFAIRTENLFDDHSRGPAVRNNVMQRDEEDVFLFADTNQFETDQGTSLQIKRSAGLFGPQFLQCFLTPFNVHEIHRNRRTGSNDLMRDGIDLAESGAKGFMPMNQVSERTMQRLDIQVTLHAQPERNIVSTTFRVQLGQKPKPLLSKAHWRHENSGR